MTRWFAPRGFSVHSCEADARPGGIFRLCMRAPGGAEYWVRGSYREVVPPERLVIDCRADDENGVEQLDEVIRVSFAAEGRGTKLTLQAGAGGSGARAAAMLGEWSGAGARRSTVSAIERAFIATMKGAFHG